MEKAQKKNKKGKCKQQTRRGVSWQTTSAMTLEAFTHEGYIRPC
jgi:hypothetical protein